MRRNCVQMYRKVPPADLMVDPGTGETMDGAPFMCSHHDLVEAVFGPVRHEFLQHAVHPANEIDTLKAIGKVRSLFEPEVVHAIDRCSVDAVNLAAAEPSHAFVRRNRGNL